MLFRFKPKVIELCKKYIEEVQKNTQWEQKTLQKIVEKSNCQVYKLPANYCAIKKHNGGIPQHMKPPVILHHQKSREFKKIVNRRR